MSEHYRKLERMYLSANINRQIFHTTSCEIARGIADIGLTVEPRYYHSLSAMHGSVYFKLLDDAAFFAVQSMVTDRFVLTTHFEIDLFKPVMSGRIHAHGKYEEDDGRTWKATSVLLNDEGKEVARGIGHFRKSKVTLDQEIGYI